MSTIVKCAFVLNEPGGRSGAADFRGNHLKFVMVLAKGVLPLFFFAVYYKHTFVFINYRISYEWRTRFNRQTSIEN